ncbi:hypothetical protein V1525DRAFT_385173 [Lipomyces kononenkoae]|uniref:Uncharacterized protein n=1 Tax=Lipomyces kononenkoae TaxID=34357 RepID=A0ACC3TA99_LIPKO
MSSGSSGPSLPVASPSSLPSVQPILGSQLGQISSLSGMTIVVESKKTYYEVGDCISGVVIITPKKDTDFTEVLITLEGTAKTWSASASIGTRIDVKDTFLNMSSPVEEDDYPSPRIFRAGVTYKFDFSFVLPEQLLESKCSHLASHRRLPSILGGPDLPWRLDDCSPDMAHISYQIVGKVCHINDSGSRKSVPYSASTSIAVITAYMPDVRNIPHNNYKNQEVSLGDDGFTRFYRTTKTLKKGIFSRSAVGNLSLEASILKPLVSLKDESVPLLLSLSYSHGDKVKKSDIRFPKIESVVARLRVYTYFSTVPMTYMPHPKSRVLDPRLGLYQESFKIADYNFVAKTSSQTLWTKESDRHYSFNTTIPLTPPKHRILVPNFWSCFIGRQYEVEVSVKLSDGNGNIRLKIPVEVMTSNIADQVRNMSIPNGECYGVLDTSPVDEDSAPEDDDPVLEALSSWGKHRVHLSAESLESRRLDRMFDMSSSNDGSSTCHDIITQGCFGPVNSVPTT